MPGMSYHTAMSAGHGEGTGAFPPTASIPTLPVGPVQRKVTIEGNPALYNGDLFYPHSNTAVPVVVHAPRVVTGGSSKVTIEGKPAAYIGSSIDCGDIIATGSTKVTCAA